MCALKQYQFTGKAIISLFALLLLHAYPQLVLGQDNQPLTLTELKAMAVKQNRLLTIGAYRVTESRDSLAAVKSKYYPNLNANAAYVYNDKNQIGIQQGQLGMIQGIPIPTQNSVYNTNHSIFAGMVRLEQPLTQLTKIATGVKAGQTDVAISEQRQSKSVQQVSQYAEKLYYGILISQKQLVQARISIQLINLQIYDVQSALMAGKTDSVNLYGLEAKLAGQQQKLMQTQNQLDNYKADLNVLLGRGADTPLELAEPTAPGPNLQPLDYYLNQAGTGNPDIKIASLTQQKTVYGITAAQKQYLPDISAFAGYSRQDITNLLPNNNFNAGLMLTWTIFDFGTRRAILHQRQVQQKEATENLSYTQERVRADLDKAYRNVSQSQLLITAAAKAVKYRQRELALKKSALLAGKVLKQDVLTTENDLAQAEADYYSARFNYQLALSDVEVAAGIYK